jgi:small subunit ribosomal protein S36
MRERLTEPSATVGDRHGTAGPSEPAASASPPARLARLRAVPPLVWALTLLHGALLVMFTVLYPPYIGPDEPQHVDMAVALTRSLAWPGPGERALALGVARTSDPFYNRGFRRRVGPYLEGDAVPRGERPSLCSAGGYAPSPTPPRYPNQMVQHGPLYYAIGAAVLKAAPGECGWPFDRLVWLLRGVSVLLVLPLPLLAWATARRLAGDGPVAQAAAALPLAVPGLTRVGALVNNDNLVILLGALLGLLLAGVVTGDRRLRTAALIGAALAAALLTKFNAVVFVPAVVAAYAVGWWRDRGPPPWRQLLLAGGVSLLGAWWWLRNLVVYGAVQPHGWSGWALRDFESHGSIGQSHPFDGFWPVYLRLLERRFWSALGLIDRPELPWAAIHGLTALLLLGILAALLLGRARGGRAGLAVLVAPAALVFFALGLWDWRYYARTGLRAGIQGRYTYPALAPLAAVVAVGYGGLFGRFRRLLPLLACLLGLGVQLLALRAVVRSFWTPSPGGDRLTDVREASAALLAWSPWPAGATLAPFVLAALLGLAALLAAAVVATRRREPRPGA